MSDEILRLTRAQVREIDRRSIEEYHIPGIVLMENAARGVAEVALRMLPPTGNVVIVCGNGNNGGDGFAAARHLHNHGVSVAIIDASHDLKGDALTNSQIAAAMRLERHIGNDLEKLLNPHTVNLVIDALFGTGLTRPLHGDAQRMVDGINASRIPILTVDVPSGLDCDTGEPLGPCIRATRTVTFVAEKAGFANPASRQFTGDITVADIGCPRELIDNVQHL